VSSKIGTTTNLGAFLQDWTLQENTSGGSPINLVGTSQAQLIKAEAGANKVYTAFRMSYTTPHGNPAFVPIAAFTNTGLETEQYYFHPDHLGSSNYITNIAGEVSQHTEYFAFGETFVEEHKGSNNSPYKFNGKELDNESDLYYYGARYYDPRISIWASVDPLAEKYPNISPYVYCFDNPVRFIDPDGMAPGDPIKILFSTSSGNMKSIGISQDFRFTPPSNRNFSGNSMTATGTHRDGGTYNKIAGTLGYPTKPEYATSASVSNITRNGLYFDSKGNPVSGATANGKLIISEYSVVETVNINAGGNIDSNINISETLTTTSYDVNIDKDGKINLSNFESSTNVAPKNKSYKFASPELKKSAESLSNENEAINKGLMDKLEAAQFNNQSKNMYQDMVRETKQSGNSYPPPPKNNN
jgi:RHS repeat-associated protein